MPPTIPINHYFGPRNNKKMTNLKNKKLQNLIATFAIVNEPELTILKFTPENHNVIKFHDLNRRFGKNADDKGKHSAELMESMEKIGVCGLGVVCWDGNNLFISDGQHRVSELKDKGRNVYVHLSKGDFLETTIALNTTAKNLTKSNFVHLMTADFPDYKILEDTLNYHKRLSKTDKTIRIPEAIIISVLANVNRNEAGKIVKNKTFKVVNEAKANETFNRIYDLQKIGLPLGLRASEAMVCLIKDKGTEYNHSLFVKRFKAELKSNPEFTEFSDNVHKITNQLKDLHDNTKDGLPKLKNAA